MNHQKLADLFTKADDVDLWSHIHENGFRYTLTAEDRAAVAVALLRQHDAAYLRSALADIAKGRGAFSPDQLTHATNCIESMKSIATGALEGDWNPAGVDPRHSQPKCHSCGGWVKVEEGGICMPCHTEQEQK